MNKSPPRVRPDEIPHQQVAIASAVEELRDNDKPRCQLHMAPGTGKTIIAMRIHEEMKSKSTLFCAPTIHLVYQTYKRWSQFGLRNYKVMVVCSEKPSRADTEELEELQKINVLVNTSPSAINKFLAGHGNKVIFSTYKSYHEVAAAAEDDFGFDLGIFDEAHHIPAHIERDSTKVLKDEILNIRKRVFLTATPKVAKSNKMGDLNWCGMDNTTHFGKPVYVLPFRKAVSDNILCDYKVIITNVDNSEIRKYRELSEDLDERVALIATVRAAVEFNLKKGLTFHSKINRASIFSEKLRQAFTILGYPDFAAIETLNYKHGVDHRSKVIHDLETSDKTSIITNVRVLGEGFDLSALDFVVIVDPKSSPIEIVQNIGRVMRKHTGKEHGNIVLPVVLDKDNSYQLRNSSHGQIVKVISALKSYDEMISTGISRTQRGKASIEDIEAFILDHVCISIGKEKEFKETSEHIKLEVLDTLIPRLDRWIATFEEWCEKNNRTPILDEDNPEGLENKLAFKMRQIIARNSSYNKRVIERVKVIYDFFNEPTPHDVFGIERIVELTGKQRVVIQNHINLMEYQPAFIRKKRKMVLKYYSEVVCNKIITCQRRSESVARPAE